MSFWDTVAGHNFTQYTMPRLVDALEKIRGEQYVVNCTPEEFEKALSEELKKKARYINHFQSGDNVTMIFEK